LLGGFAFIHATAGEHEIIQPGAVTFDQRNLFVFDQYDASPYSHNRLQRTLSLGAIELC
jgi:hypothetical protein